MGDVIRKPRHFWTAGTSRVRDVCRLAYLFATELAAEGKMRFKAGGQGDD